MKADDPERDVGRRRNIEHPTSNAQRRMKRSREADDPKAPGSRAVMIQFESGKFLFTDRPSQNHDRDQDAAGD
jgi:hypothetical protein